MLEIECTAETETDSDIQPIATTSTSIAANRLLAVVCLFIFLVENRDVLFATV